MPSISYAITACNEYKELDHLLSQLTKTISSDDEIIVQLDSDNFTQEVEQVVEKYSNITRIYFALNNDFSVFKNNLKKHCIKDYIFFIDADEYLSEDLIRDIKLIISENIHTQLFLVPRINTVEGLTQEHIQNWGWNVNDKGWVNFPDYQTRVVKNEPEIVWKNKVHEQLSGFKLYASLPDEYCLIHPKTIEKQERQNNFYNLL
jgi:glycosyltransferase involved in cell wall biosynthesis